MKTLIIEIIEPKRLGELVTVSREFCEKPDIVAVGAGQIPGSFAKAYQVEDTVASNLVSDLASLILKEGYEIVLLSASTLGSGIAAPLSIKLSAPVVSEVIGIKPELVVERPLYGGKAVATYKLKKMPAVLTIRRKYFESADLQGFTEPTLLGPGEKKVELIAEREEKAEGIPLEDAEVIVSGGRGIGSAENFSMLQNMADFFNGAVGASRGAVDEGWVPPTQQVGQTGKIVAPSVYFAVGISGASQHLAGIANAKCVVAINKDEDANIFKRARFGVVSDYKKIVPVLIETLKEEA
ncbi:electron transfer flavoprotein subunit alpha [Desulfosarcina ovata subsp. sediminis]|uniref:Electron transfer flavoprotein subunit alpha n=1 Tax=Desulfosarcina ovata subsp. sediminis TaxID=885957 RepID=A0A5K7ZBB7_9BACT|nr:electron transfer flavoprotein subunit alpha/FixB family protein [Desulfosarcina ovata]BBO79468.1 electron transfer flavoprotein subunit alpha [Desulfosarcina ovata subsp. sediminis]